jgi:nucleotide-binding universal stress UspA family protein
MKTTKLKKVLIALDYDPTAKKVAEAGFSMASAMNAEVTLLHIISDPVYYSSTAYSPIMGLIGEVETFPMQLDNVEGLKVVSQHFLDKFKHHLGDEAIITLVEEGDFASTILKTAKSIHADVIVMGSHSKKWLENIVLGSVTGDVLKHTAIPLFIIPTKKQE